MLMTASLLFLCRTAYSYRKPNTFLPYAGAQANYTFPYTFDTWNTPRALWQYAASRVFGAKPVGGSCKRRARG